MVAPLVRHSATAPRAFVIGSFAEIVPAAGAGRPSFIWRRVCDKLTWCGRERYSIVVALYLCRSEVFVRSALA